MSLYRGDIYWQKVTFMNEILKMKKKVVFLRSIVSSVSVCITYFFILELLAGFPHTLANLFLLRVFTNDTDVNKCCLMDQCVV